MSARRGERSPFVTSDSVDEGEFNAESYEPSAERSLRISRCKARMRENENAAEGVKACVTPKLVRSGRLCRNVTQVSIIGRITTHV